MCVSVFFFATDDFNLTTKVVVVWISSRCRRGATKKKNTNNKFASYHYYYHYSIYYFSQPSAHFFLALFHFSSQYTTTGLHHQFTCIYPRTNATKRSNPGNNRLESSVLFSKLDLNSREILIISVNGDLQDQIVQIL